MANIIITNNSAGGSGVSQYQAYQAAAAAKNISEESMAAAMKNIESVAGGEKSESGSGVKAAAPKGET